MTLRVETVGGDIRPADPRDVEALLAEGGFFWLDLHDPGADELQLLRTTFGFHPLALEDSAHFGQRPKVELYDDVAFVVAYGAADDDDGLVEVHCFLGGRYLVTVHRDTCDAFERLGQAPLPEGVGSPAVAALHRVLDALTDSFFPRLETFDDRVEALADRILAAPDAAQLRSVLDGKRSILAQRQRVEAQRAMVARIVAGTVELPGATAEARRYFRDVEDHLTRLGDRYDAQRDMLTGTANLYLSAASNRLNEVMKRLTIVATIFLPLTFVTGFFGQNFEWMVEHVRSLEAFLAFGVGGTLAAAAAIVAWMRSRHLR